MSTLCRFLSSTPRIPVYCTLLLLITSSAAAQETRATVFGTVRDASGGVLQGVPVVVTNDETNITNQAASNASGAFELTKLLVTQFQLRFTF